MAKECLLLLCLWEDGQGCWLTSHWSLLPCVCVCERECVSVCVCVCVCVCV